MTKLNSDTSLKFKKRKIYTIAMIKFKLIQYFILTEKDRINYI